MSVEAEDEELGGVSAPDAEDDSLTNSGQSSSSACEDSFDEDFESLRQDVMGLLAMHEELEGRVGQLYKAVERLDEGLAETLSRATEARNDLSDGRHRGHLDLRQKYRLFLEQQVAPAAMKECLAHPRHGYRPERVARFAADICVAVFRLSEERLQNLLKLPYKSSGWGDTAKSLARGAEEIELAADRLDLQFCWDFYFRPHSPIDEQWQEPWGSCDPGCPVRFVVSPAYVVEGRIFARQLVFTSPKKSGNGA
ncbi:hypothetical protein [Micromonospora sp. NPDC049274]|uniref:hypothetical protein n=1 Tax=Micromonospora sp. NPDC049274 TaxID=3154829 RepID=UPI003445D92C